MKLGGLWILCYGLGLHFIDNSISAKDFQKGHTYIMHRDPSTAVEKIKIEREKEWAWEEKQPTSEEGN